MEKKNGDRQGENNVEFIKNKNSLKRKFVEEKEEEKEKEEKEKERKIPKSGKLQEVFSDRLEQFFKKKILKKKTVK